MKKLFFISFILTICACSTKYNGSNKDIAISSDSTTNDSSTSTVRKAEIKMKDTTTGKKSNSITQSTNDTTKTQKVKIIHSHLTKDVEQKKAEINKKKFNK